MWPRTCYGPAVSPGPFLLTDAPDRSRPPADRKRRVHMRFRAIGAAFGVLTLAASLAACGGSTSGVEQGSAGQELKGASIRVGSKEFTEQLVLGQMTLHLL